MKFTWKLWILIIFLAFSFLSIFVSSNGVTFFQKGVIIASVEKNSTAFEQGLRQGQIITKIDGQQISNLGDFTSAIKNKYDSGENIKTIITTDVAEFILFSKENPKITVTEIPKTNLKTRLDLAGGSRALIQAKGEELNSQQIQELVDVTSNRLNEFGLTDLKVLPISDLTGKNFMLVEIAGATPKDLQDLLSKQGKFEAKIGNETVFGGGKRDIASVSRNAQSAYVEACSPSAEGYFCRFRFGIFLSEESAQRHAEITKKLEINSSNPEYLSKKLDLYLDGNLVDSLFIGKDLQGSVTTQISISGSGSGATENEAYTNAEEEMHKLQTVLVTGSLPFQLEIVKLDTISPLLGKEFIRTIFLAGIVALLAVGLIVFIRYRKIKASLALLLTSVSEILIILGIASLIEWNLDLPSIAGILATIGTGIDQQIIILDEAKQKTMLSIKQKLKRAFSIILGAYFTAVVALIPLLWAGAGLLKGFAVTTIIGITVGVLITRPAFTDLVKRIEGD